MLTCLETTGGNTFSRSAFGGSFSLEERFAYGNFTVREVCELKNRCHSGFYEDVKSGLVTVEKVSKKTVIRGPVARAYIAGLPLPVASAA